MKKVIYETFGNPAEVLKVVEMPTPAMQDGQARVEVLRAPINPSDLVQIAGEYGVKPDLPAVAGNEGLGRVVEVAGDGLTPGQMVLLPAGTGTWVSEVVAPIRAFTPLPDGDPDQLCMLLVNPATALLLLTDFVDLQPGDWVIQSAANSGVGGYVAQLAKARGLNLINVVRRESAIADLKELGAEHVLVDGPDLARRVREVSGKSMALALDAVAGDTAGRLAETLRRRGTLVNYGAMSMKPLEIVASSLIFRDVTLRGFWLVNWFESASKETQMATYAELTRMVMTGELYAPIDRHFSLDDIREAVAYTWQGGRSGKVLVAPNGI